MSFKMLNESQQDMEQFLLEMGKKYHSDSTTFTHDFIYRNLIDYGVYLNEAKVKTKQWYPIWMANLGKLNNLDLHLPKKSKDFLQLRNVPSNVNVENYIKLYIPIHRSHFNQCVQVLFTFLSNENIIHDSKIRNQISDDAIVVRVTNKEDVERIINFIKQNELFNTALLKPNPFAPKKDGIAIVKDGHLSYNSILCYYIEDYIKHEKHCISLPRFYGYLEKSYQEAFVLGYHLSVLAHSHHIDYQFKHEEDYYKKMYDDKYITEILMKVVGGHESYEGILLPIYENTKEETNIDELRLFARKKELEYHNACDILNKALEINSRLMGVNNTVNAFNMFVGHGSAMGFTRKENARKLIEENLSREVLSYILKDLTPEDYVRMEAYNLGYIEREVSLDAVDQFIHDLIESLVYTRKKHLKEMKHLEQKQQIKSMLGSIKEGNFDCITNDNQQRKKLIMDSKKIRLNLLDKMLMQFMLESGETVEDEDTAIELFSELLTTLELDGVLVK